MRIAGTVVVVFAVVAAGCLGGDPGSPTPSTTSSSTQSTTVPTTGPDENETVNPEVPTDELLLTGCVASVAFRNYPVPLAPSERPENWGPSSPDRTPSVSIYTLKCERIALEGFERGPIHLLLDAHNNVSPPTDCKADTGASTRFQALHHLVLDDQEIAEHLQSRYGIPTLLATFNEQSHDLGASAYHEWLWAIDGAAPSTVTVFDAKENHAYPTERERHFWQVGNGLSSLYFELDGNGPTIQLPANGTIQPPMLLASDTGGHFVGSAAWLDSVHVQGKFTRYADLACKEPLT